MLFYVNNHTVDFLHRKLDNMTQEKSTQQDAVLTFVACKLKVRCQTCQPAILGQRENEPPI